MTQLTPYERQAARAAPLINLSYMHADNGNCRVYYRGSNKRLYCWQLADHRTGKFELLSCSKDGEPDCPVRMECFAETPEPTGDEPIESELREFLSG